jgi:hypothetical protein
MACAALGADGYLAQPATPVGALDGFWTRLEAAAPSGPILVGFDFPISPADSDRLYAAHVNARSASA